MSGKSMELASFLQLAGRTNKGRFFLIQKKKNPKTTK